jgi:hypothetical protein
VEGARKRPGQKGWSARFTMADTPDYPDTNCTLFIDPQERLWLLWPTILANEWHTALMKYRIASEYHADGPPRWEISEVLHVTPGASFETAVLAYADSAEARLRSGEIPEDLRPRMEKQLQETRTYAQDKLSRRLGWMTRAHPVVIDGTRMIVPLYSDGFSFSLMTFTDDWGKTWRTSTPLTGAGNIQPSIVQRKDGSLYTLMRDNGPAPKRLHQSSSFDRGETWTPVTDSDLPNPGAGAEIIVLRNGNWLLISNDTEAGRHRLSVQISSDEGRTWKWKRALEAEAPGPGARQFHYPSIIEGRDGTFHATYSYHGRQANPAGAEQPPIAAKSIKYVRFNEAWIQQGDAR